MPFTFIYYQKIKNITHNLAFNYVAFIHVKRNTALHWSFEQTNKIPSIGYAHPNRHIFLSIFIVCTIGKCLLRTKRNNSTRTHWAELEICFQTTSCLSRNWEGRFVAGLLCICLSCQLPLTAILYCSDLILACAQCKAQRSDATRYTCIPNLRGTSRSRNIAHTYAAIHIQTSNQSKHTRRGHTQSVEILDIRVSIYIYIYR